MIETPFLRFWRNCCPHLALGDAWVRFNHARG